MTTIDVKTEANQLDLADHPNQSPNTKNQKFKINSNIVSSRNVHDQHNTLKSPALNKAGNNVLSYSKFSKFTRNHRSNSTDSKSPFPH